MPPAAVRRAIATGRPLVVFDLEFTAWEGSQARGWSGPGEHPEVVQIGAVRLDPAEGFAERACFDQLVRPTINPVLSDYFITLTGIRQSDVDSAGISFPEAMAAFRSFVDGAEAVFANGYDRQVLEENCRLNGIDFALPVGLFHNVGGMLARLAGVGGHVSSANLPDRVPGVPRLPAHHALSDARMVAAALARLVTAP